MIAWTTLDPAALAPSGLVVAAGVAGVRSIDFVAAGDARRLRARGESLMAARFPSRGDGGPPRAARRHLETAVSELVLYFRGRLDRFSVPVDYSWCATPFAARVWEALLAIPYGQSLSYGGVAARIGMPSAARAVGGAAGRNPIPILIPCHRVIGGDGRLTGFSSGLRIKIALLAIEAGRAAPRSGRALAPVTPGTRG
jgi:methylated-DNA-[protein]-cysteine S-methyltransferase